MAEFLTTNGTSYYIETIIIEAKSKLVLVSPYLQLSKNFHLRLKDASSKGVKIVIIYGKDELKPNERNSLAELDNIELYYFENLHAKCYFNETKMVITSMNMYEFSEKNNREMGVLIDSVVDKDLFNKAVTEALSILQASERDELKKKVRNVSSTTVSVGTFEGNSGNVRGYCLRCQSRIDYNPSKPYCNGCYASWSYFQNWDFPETVCHRCGEYGSTSIAKPQCSKCYNLFQNKKEESLNNKVDILHNNLIKQYPSDKINRTDDYIYFNKVLKSMDAFICSKEITVKVVRKTESEIKTLNGTIRQLLKDYSLEFEHKDNYKLCYWKLNLKNGSLVEIQKVIDNLRMIRMK